MVGQIEKFKDNDNKKLVDIHAYCLMNNHYHMLIEQKAEDGLQKFIQKLGTGYTMYFNHRYMRSGCLFESSYKSKEIKSDGYFFHIFRYIHLNPLKYFDKDWKNGLNDVDGAINYLKSYKWSSFTHIFKDTGSFVNEDNIRQEFRNLTEYVNFLTDWIRFGVPKSI